MPLGDNPFLRRDAKIRKSLAPGEPPAPKRGGGAVKRLASFRGKLKPDTAAETPEIPKCPSVVEHGWGK